MKRLLLSLALIGCGSVSQETPIDSHQASPASADEPKEETKYVVTLLVDAGSESTDSSVSADVSPIDGGTCEDSGPVVWHCLTHMNTLCIAYASDHEAECRKTGQYTGWFPGDCGSDESSSLSRSIGGCMDSCGQVSWMYRLGGLPPTEQASQDLQRSCEDIGKTYVPVPHNSF